MFFALAKLLTILERPSDLLLLLLVIGVVLLRFARTRRAGTLLATGVAVALVAITFLPLAAWVEAPLENRFPRPAVLPGQVDGVIVLGGAVIPQTTARRDLPSLNGDAERMTEFVRLAKLYPQAKLVFSGGAAALHVDPEVNEAMVARLFFRQQGLDVGRVVFEQRSRDTYENVLFSRDLVRPRPGETWLLVASAADAPRSVGIFRKLGWPVLPVPVAYKSDGLDQNLTGNLGLLDRAVHEWLGLIAYRLAGRTDALFPAPAKE